MKKVVTCSLLVGILFLASCGAAPANAPAVTDNQATSQAEVGISDNAATSQAEVGVNDNSGAGTSAQGNAGAQIVNIGQNVDYADHYNIAFTDFYFSTKVKPTNPDSYYTYYEVKDTTANTYFVLKTIIKNLGTETLKGERLPEAVLIYDGKYKYDCQAIMEEDDGSDLEGYDWYLDIEPLKTKNIWYLVEVPNEIELSQEKSLDVEFVVNNTTYQVALR